MELLITLLTSVLGLLGAPGILIDRAGADVIRQQLYRAEILEVRVESTPTYQILQGNVDRVRLGGRGIYPVEFLRIEAVDIESDPISIDPNSLTNNRIVLRRPLQASARVVITSEDINRALRSPNILNSFKGLKINLGGGAVDQFDLIDPEIIFLRDNLIQLKMKLRPTDPQKPVLDIEAQAKINLTGGRRIQLEGVSINLQGVRFPDEILQTFTNNLNELLDLKQLESRGILARVLKLEITESKLQVIGFLRVERFD
ncbi:MAG: DUF2993 domain-containing protein [Pseudanabaenaceae cyanobacterium]